jgi:uncharacterized protein
MSHIRVGLLLSFAFAVVVAGSPAEAQSFNCRYAKAADEVLICQSPRLAGLDERMSSIYFRLRNSLPGRQRASLEADQAAWLRGRQACGRDGSCIEDAYRRRIQELLSY